MKLIICSVALGLFIWLAGYSLEQTRQVAMEPAMNKAMDDALDAADDARPVVLIPNREMILSAQMVDLFDGPDVHVGRATIRQAELGVLRDRGKIPKLARSFNFD